MESEALELSDEGVGLWGRRGARDTGLWALIGLVGEQDMIGQGEDSVAHGDSGALLAAPSRQRAETAAQVRVLAAPDRSGRADQGGAPPARPAPGFASGARSRAD